jgi:hypothetical protein
MTFSQTYRTAITAIAGFLLTAAIPMGAVAQATPLRGLEILSLFTVLGPMDRAGPK